MSSISSTSSSYSLTSMWENLNSISTTTSTTARFFSANISKSNLNSSLISEFDSINNSDNSFHEILSQCNSIKNGTVKANVKSLVASSSSSSDSDSSSSTTSAIDTLV